MQFESSGRWPDDLVAVRALKTAFYLKMSRLLSEEAGLSCRAQRDEVVINCDGFFFSGRIHHEKEERLCVMAGEDQLARSIRAHTSAGVRHTSAMHTMSTQHPAFGPSVRLAKRWLHCQLLSGMFAAEMVELMVGAVFGNHPRAPGSAVLGFVLFLQLLERCAALPSPPVAHALIANGPSQTRLRDRAARSVPRGRADPRDARRGEGSLRCGRWARAAVARLDPRAWWLVLARRVAACACAPPCARARVELASPPPPVRLL